MQRDFEIDKPCACGANELLDIKAVVKSGVAQIHPSAAGDEPVASVQVLGPGTVDLDCGRFAYGTTTIGGENTRTTLNVPGRTALFIDGDLKIAGDFELDVGASGELDVFVGDNLFISGTGTIGSRKRPAAVRFYVGGSEPLSINGSQLFAANLYAPFADVFLNGAQETWGSWFIGSFQSAGTQTMHYDSAILGAGAAPKTCDAPPAKPPPTPPGDTPPAPPAGPPPGCEVDPDCPSPMVCIAGNCEYLGPQ